MRAHVLLVEDSDDLAVIASAALDRVRTGDACGPTTRRAMLGAVLPGRGGDGPARRDRGVSPWTTWRRCACASTRAALRVREVPDHRAHQYALDPTRNAPSRARSSASSPPAFYGPAPRDAVLSATAHEAHGVPMTSRQILDGSTRTRWPGSSSRAAHQSPARPHSGGVDRDGRKRSSRARAGRHPSPARCRPRPGEGALGARADRDRPCALCAVQIAGIRSPPAPSKVPRPSPRGRRVMASAQRSGPVRARARDRAAARRAGDRRGRRRGDVRVSRRSVRASCASRLACRPLGCAGRGRSARCNATDARMVPQCDSTHRMRLRSPRRRDGSAAPASRASCGHRRGAWRRVPRWTEAPDEHPLGPIAIPADSRLRVVQAAAAADV